MGKTIITDDMLYYAASTAEDIIVESLDFDDGPDIVFSDEYKRNIDKMIKEQDKLIKKAKKIHMRFNVSRNMNKAAVFTLVFISAMGFSLSAMADKGKLFEMLVKVEERLTGIQFQMDEKNELTGLVVKIPQYIPEGFEEQTKQQRDDLMIIDYCNDKNQRIIYTQKFFFNIDTIADTEETVMEVIPLNGRVAYYYFNKNYSFLIWEDGKYKYRLRGNCSKEEIIKMAESIK